MVVSKLVRMQALLLVCGGSHVQRRREDTEAAKGPAGAGAWGLIVRNSDWDWRGVWLKAGKRGEGLRVLVDFEKGAELQ